MIYILYSDDYEVYLGGNYHPEKEVLIDTTERLLSACEDSGIPMTLFCDLPCVWRYRELGYSEFPDLVNLQLKRVIEQGHDVQIHIHPHWLETKIIFDKNNTTRYDFNPSKFLLGNWFPEGGISLRNFCADLLKRAKSYLEGLLCPVRPSYRCIAFRAGGYGLQPNPKEILMALTDAELLIDSSIVPGMVTNTNVNRIDFSTVPRKGNYFISPDFGLDKASSKGIYEIPLLSLRQGEASWPLAIAFPRRIVRNTIKRVKLQRLGYTVQSEDTTSRENTLFGRIWAQIGAIRRGFWELECGQDVRLMVDCTRRYINRYGNSKGDLYFSFSCHSKGMNLMLIDALRRYHFQLTKIYGGQLKAITFQEAARNLNLVQKRKV